MRPALAAGVLAFAGLASVPAAAHAADPEIDSNGILISVVIEPLECAAGCGGELPATGAAMPSLAMWLGVALLVAGAALLLRRAVLRRWSGVAFTASANPYYVVSGHRTDSTHGGRAFPSSTSSPRGDDAGARDFERGDGQCPNR